MRDVAYMSFLVAGVLMGIVYQQMYNSLPVYLRDNHGVEPQGYGLLLTTSAIIVVLFQFGVTRLIKHRPPFIMMALGTMFYMIGFGMFGFVAWYGLFALAIMIITIGEMIVMPTMQAMVADFAPPEMRGRYMAMFGLLWAIPAAIGPAAAGIILDNYNPNLLWYIGGVICAISALWFYALHLRVGKQERFAPAPPDMIPAPAQA